MKVEVFKYFLLVCLIYFQFFPTRQAFSEELPLTLLCESDELLEIGDVVGLVPEPVSIKEKINGEIPIVKVRKITNNSQPIFGVVSRTGAKIKKYNPEVIRKKYEEAIRRNASERELMEILTKSPEISYSDGYEIVIFGFVENCKIITSSESIKVGDLLTVEEDNPGYAKKLTSSNTKLGTILGYALGTMPKGGKGTIPVFVNIR